MPRAQVWPIAVVLATSWPAHAHGLDLPGVGPQATAHAGATVTSTDDLASPYYNPAALARRPELRAATGLALTSRTLDFESAIDFSAQQAQTVRNGAATQLLPWVGGAVGIGDSVVVGISVLSPSSISYALPEAPVYDQPDPMEEHRYPQRYAASRFALERRAVAVGVGVHALPWLAVGATALAFDVHLAESRTFWGGLPAAAEPLYAPRFDMAFTADAADSFVPAGVVGFLVAPGWAPVEIAASLSVADAAHLDGPATLANSRGTTGEPPQPYATAEAIAPRAHLRLPMPATLRAGARYLGRRFTLEAEVDVEHGGAASADELVWHLEGLSATHHDGQGVTLDRVSLGPALQDRRAVRVATDVDLVPTFLTLSAGYSFASAWVPKRYLSTALPDLDTHTVGLGVEARVAGCAIAVGVSRSEGVARSPSQAETGVMWTAPFAEGRVPVGGGRYDGAETLVSFGIEVATP